MLAFKDVSFTYSGQDSHSRILKNFNLFVNPGEVVSILGLSGRGKTTIGRLALGLNRPDVGQVLWNGRLTQDCQRQMGAVFQDYSTSLFGWLSVKTNVILGLGSKDINTKSAPKRVTECLALAGLGPESRRRSFLDKPLHQLSGGQAQRVAIARAIVHQPSLLVLDEPFASLDSVHRKELQKVFVQLCINQGMSALMITHDIDEAILVADRVIILIKREGEPSYETIRLETQKRLGKDGLVRIPSHEVYVSRAYDILEQDEILREQGL